MKEGAQAAGPAIQQGAQDTGAAIKQGAEDTGSFFSRTAKQVRDGAVGVYHKVHDYFAGG